jgi:hypothetical protein
MKRSKPTLFSFILIGTGIFAIILAVLLVSNETKEAEVYCKEMNGTYHWKYFHFCNEDVIQKYKIFGKTFWSYEINLTQTVNPEFLK